MSSVSELEDRHSNLRQKLDVLGYCQPLPINSVGIVEKILDDLIFTTNSFKTAKIEIQQLREEKTAWDLGVEIYKCDNSKLLAENNSLHLELIRQKDKTDYKHSDLLRKIQNLELDKKYLEEHSAELAHKIRELELKYTDSSGGKLKKDGANMNKKPFISTVRSGYLVPKHLDSLNNDTKCLKCNCNTLKQNDVMQEIQKLQNDTKNQTALLENYQKQLNARDREIQRLHTLFSGTGRPLPALAKDCCFKGVNALAEDVNNLQQEKKQIQIQLTESIQSQHEAMQRAIYLAEKNHELENELQELEKLALHVEAKANMSITDKDTQNAELESKLNKSKKRIRELENQLTHHKHPGESDYDKTNFQSEYKKFSTEKKQLNEKLNAMSEREMELLAEIEKLSKKNSKIKTKMATLQKESLNLLAKNDNGNNGKPITSSGDLGRNYRTDEEYNVIKCERDFYQKEYLNLLEKRNINDDANVLKIQLADKESLIVDLKNEIDTIKFQTESRSDRNDLMTNRSVQTAIHRVERERDIAKAEAQKMEIERDALRDRMKFSTETQINEQRRTEELLQNSYDKIARLESDKNRLITSQIPTQAAINLLGEEIENLKVKLRETQEENSQIRLKYNQIRILQEQTEKSLIDYQNKLMLSENQIGHIETKLSHIDSNRELAQNEAGTLRGDLIRYKNLNASLEREKDKLTIELDQKTEKVFKLESELRDLIADKKEIDVNMEQLRRKLDQNTVDTLNKEDSLRDAASESNTIKKQMSTLKRSYDNVIAENSRLANELSDVTTEVTIIKRKLKESQKEVESLKSQLQQYVQEVQRAEELLMRKENEREEMLDHYRSLSHDAIVLEGNNHSLEIEAAETKKQLLEAESKLNDFESHLNIRENEIKDYEKQINDLSTQIAKLEIELENSNDDNKMLKTDLDAVKELCNKLDLERDKLNAELTEHSSIRQQVERENEILRNELKSDKTGNKVASSGMKELLATSREDLEQQRISLNQVNLEVIRLRQKIEELQHKLDEEHQNAKRHEALANEYSVQILELRHLLTNGRFEQVKAKDEEKKRNNSDSTDESPETAISDSLNEQKINKIRKKNILCEDNEKFSNYSEEDSIEIVNNLEKKKSFKNTELLSKRNAQLNEYIKDKYKNYENQSSSFQNVTNYLTNYENPRNTLNGKHNSNFSMNYPEILNESNLIPFDQSKANLVYFSKTYNPTDSSDFMADSENTNEIELNNSKIFSSTIIKKKLSSNLSLYASAREIDSENLLTDASNISDDSQLHKSKDTQFKSPIETEIVKKIDESNFVTARIIPKNSSSSIYQSAHESSQNTSTNDLNKITQSHSKQLINFKKSEKSQLNLREENELDSNLINKEKCICLMKKRKKSSSVRFSDPISTCCCIKEVSQCNCVNQSSYSTSVKMMMTNEMENSEESKQIIVTSSESNRLHYDTSYLPPPPSFTHNPKFTGKSVNVHIVTVAGSGGGSSVSGYTSSYIVRKIEEK